MKRRKFIKRLAGLASLTAFPALSLADSRAVAAEWHRRVINQTFYLSAPIVIEAREFVTIFGCQFISTDRDYVWIEAPITVIADTAEIERCHLDGFNLAEGVPAIYFTRRGKSQ